MKLHQIVPQLYQRGAFAHLPDKVAGLRSVGIEVVVSLWRADPDLRDIVEYHHMPTSDGMRIDRGLYGARAIDIARWVREGRSVLVHCQGGRNRSGLLNALVVRDLYGCTGADAARIVQMGRPGSLANPYFRHFLETLPTPRRGYPDPTSEIRGFQDDRENERSVDGAPGGDGR